MRAFALLRNGAGGIDLGAGFDSVCAYLGVRDVEGLLMRLEIMLGWRPPAQD